MRRVMVFLGAALLFSAACSSGAGQKAPADPTYKLPPRPVRDGEVALQPRTVSDGQIAFTAIGLTTKLTVVTGSHADASAKGQFVRVRMVVENDYPTFHSIEMNKQLLVTTDGKTYQTDGNAMRVKRQPTEFMLGSHDRFEFDLLYDIPKTAEVRSLRLYGDPTTDLGLPLENAPGVEAPLSG